MFKRQRALGEYTDELLEYNRNINYDKKTNL